MNQYEAAVKAAEPLNPDGWAVDPEELLAGVSEHLWEREHFDGKEAAVTEARRMWHVHNNAFKAASTVEKRGYHAAHVIEIERVGAALTRPRRAS